MTTFIVGSILTPTINGACNNGICNNKPHLKKNSVESKKDKCTGQKTNGVYCTNNAFEGLFKDDKPVCKMHIKPKNVKNSLYDRAGSTRYALCITMNKTPPSNYKEKEELPVHEFDKDKCFYCEINKATLIDHIYPVIYQKLPTVYYVESVHNKVPCCKKCNESKGNKDPNLFIKTKINNVDVLQEKFDIMDKVLSNIPMYSENESRKRNRNFRCFMILHNKYAYILENDGDLLDTLISSTTYDDIVDELGDAFGKLNI
jgi:hypothetical protein